MIRIVTDRDCADIADQVDAQIEAGIIDPPNPFPVCSPHWYAWSMAVPIAWHVRLSPFMPQRQHWWNRPLSNGVGVVLAAAAALGWLLAIVGH